MSQIALELFISGSDNPSSKLTYRWKFCVVEEIWDEALTKRTAAEWALRWVFLKKY